ncbi:MAG TPA: HEPN domain-containing protein [Pyrinomonadaceae bacterium]|jgi:hypothetical protein
MKIDEKVIERLNQLIEKGDSVLKTYKSGVGSSGGVSYFVSSSVNSQLSYEWGVSCLSLINRVFGEESDHYRQFARLADNLWKYNSATIAQGILKSAKDDYENGYLFDTRTLIEAEIFSDLIEHSEELFKKGYYQTSAVIAGCVLEDALRKLCQKNNITFPKKPTIEPMNVELAKIGLYNQFIKDKVSSLGKLRNHAAHGEWTEFNEKDVEDMIRDVRRFMEDYFS